MTNPDRERNTNFVKPVTVYVTNWGYHEYASLSRYGQAVPITSGSVDFRKTDRLRAKIVAVLKDMQPDDLICLSGSSTITAEVIAVVMAKFGHVNYVYYEPYYTKYLRRATNGTSPEIPDEQLGGESDDYSNDEIVG